MLSRTFEDSSASDVEVTELWERVDELVGPERGLSDLRVHHLQLLAASRWRRSGLKVPDELVLEERDFAARRLASGVVLRKVREAASGPVVAFKGPEAAAHYRDPGTRPFVDLDVLVPDPEETHRLLLEAGFQPFGEEEEYYDGLHHVQPLRWRGLPLSVELHHHPNWVDWATPPSGDALFGKLVPALLGVDGISALEPRANALVLAVNSWSDAPLRRVLDLVDIAAVLGPLDPSAVQPLADEWDVGGVWRVTTDALGHVLYGAPAPSAIRVWGKATASVRDVTVVENHARRLVSLFWALPFHRALRIFPRFLARELGPTEGETWGSKLTRMRAAVRNAFSPRSQHDDALGMAAHQLRRSRRRGRADDDDDGPSTS
jgi:putative nucleotidyltransferase-like protein